jgi:hypothetical protein
MIVMNHACGLLTPLDWALPSEPGGNEVFESGRSKNHARVFLSTGSRSTLLLSPSEHRASQMGAMRKNGAEWGRFTHSPTLVISSFLPEGVDPKPASRLRPYSPATPESHRTSCLLRPEDHVHDVAHISFVRQVFDRRVGKIDPSTIVIGKLSKKLHTGLGIEEIPALE